MTSTSTPARCWKTARRLVFVSFARRLFISEHTVRSHVKSMLRKLGVSSRRDALEQLALARR